MQESDSFWTDIKKLEEQLVKSPDSFCFARLSDVYLKVGLIDDALHVARQGVMKHPAYLSGQRALAMACHAKGLNDEALAALTAVVEAVPEEIPAQKLLGRLYAETGNSDAALRSFRTALEFAPDDVECRLEMESLVRSTGMAGSSFESVDGDDEIIEDMEILDEIDILEEDQTDSESEFQEAPAGPDTQAAKHHDPLSTVTLAELYVSQGFIHKALEIYRALLVDNPVDQLIAERVVELEDLEAGIPVSDEIPVDSADEDTEVEDESEAFFMEPEAAPLPDSAGTAAPDIQDSADVSWMESAAPAIPQQDAVDNDKRGAGLARLESALSAAQTLKEDIVEEKAAGESAFSVAEEAFFQETEPAAEPEPLGGAAFETQRATAEFLRHESGVGAVPPQGIADNALATLEGWLENIGRIKSCH